MLIQKIPTNYILNLNKVENFFRNPEFFSKDKFDNLSRMTNTNNFVFSGTFIPSNEKFFVSGMTVGKYIDVWPSAMEEIFLEIAGWRMRRTCPYIDLFDDNEHDLKIIPNHLDSEKWIRSIKDLNGFNDVIFKDNHLSLAYLGEEFVSYIKEKTNGNGFPLYCHCNALRHDICSWLMVGLRLIVKYNEKEKDVDVVI